MKKLLAIILILLLPITTNASGVMMMGGGTPAAGGRPADLLFFWRCEGTTLDSPNNDYSGEDTTATAVGTAALNATAVKVGTNGGDFTTTGAESIFYFNQTAGSGNMVSGVRGRIGFWVYINTFEVNGSFFWITQDGSNYVVVTMRETAEAIDLRFIAVKAGQSTALKQFDTNLASDTWYFIEVAYDFDSVGNQTTGSCNFIIDNVAQTAQTFAWTANYTGIGAISFGALGIATDSIYEDNIMISNDDTRSLYSWRNNTSTPTE